eukprot:SAG31_NODE_38659_length_294_cov_1.128205_1_plen_97_part_01
MATRRGARARGRQRSCQPAAQASHQVDHDLGRPRATPAGFVTPKFSIGSSEPGTSRYLNLSTLRSFDTEMGSPQNEKVVQYPDTKFSTVVDLTPCT